MHYDDWPDNRHRRESEADKNMIFPSVGTTAGRTLRITRQFKRITRQFRRIFKTSRTGRKRTDDVQARHRSSRPAPRGCYNRRTFVRENIRRGSSEVEWCARDARRTSTASVRGRILANFVFFRNTTVSESTYLMFKT